MNKETLTIIDNRTDKTYELPLTDGNIRSMDLRQIKKDAEDFGVMGYDPAFMNTASCRSRDHIHRRRQRAFFAIAAIPSRNSPKTARFSRSPTCCSTANCPPKSQLKEWVDLVKLHTMIHETTKKFLEGFRYDAHPMAMLISTVAALSTVYKDARQHIRSRSRGA